MRFLYLTDFHGNKTAYEAAFSVAVSSGCQAVVNGGDALPNDIDFNFAMVQRHFFETWLRPRMAELACSGIRNYMMFGNDDAQSIIGLLEEADSQGIATRFDGRGWRSFGDYWILGFPYVPDYAFRQKDWCHGDTDRNPCAEQLGSPLGSGEKDYVPYNRPWNEELQDRPSLSEMLRDLPLSPDPDRSIFCMHAPPHGIGLDVCFDHRLAGSMAGKEHILDRQYLLSLHGHIHESPRMTGRWHGELGKTICVQPGSWPPVPVLIDLDARSVTHPILGLLDFHPGRK